MERQAGGQPGVAGGAWGRGGAGGGRALRAVCEFGFDAQNGPLAQRHLRHADVPTCGGGSGGGGSIRAVQVRPSVRRGVGRSRAASARAARKQQAFDHRTHADTELERATCVAAISACSCALGPSRTRGGRVASGAVLAAPIPARAFVPRRIELRPALGQRSDVMHRQLLPVAREGRAIAGLRSRHSDALALLGLQSLPVLTRGLFPGCVPFDEGVERHHTALAQALGAAGKHLATLGAEAARTAKRRGDAESSAKYVVPNFAGGCVPSQNLCCSLIYPSTYLSISRGARGVPTPLCPASPTGDPRPTDA